MAFRPGGGGRLSKKEIKRGTDVVRSIAFTYDTRGWIQTRSTPEGAGAFPDTLRFGTMRRAPGHRGR